MLYHALPSDSGHLPLSVQLCGSCSIQPALFVRVRFILPSPVLLGPVSIYLKWSYEERTFLQMMPVVEQGLDGGETGKMLLLSLCSPGAPWSDGDVP